MVSVVIKPGYVPDKPFQVFVDNEAVNMTARDLASFQSFNVRVIEELCRSLPPMGPAAFNQLIDAALNDCRAHRGWAESLREGQRGQRRR
jgi:hypothetical protein